MYGGRVLEAALTTCNLCGKASFRRLYGRLHEVIGYEFVRCRGCGLIQISSKRTVAEEEAFYEEQYHLLSHKVREPDSRLGLFECLLDLLETETSGRRLLDAGCGTGEFVAAAAARGWDAEGVDISREAVERGAERYGVRLHCGRLGNGKWATGRYDVLTFWNVLDQVPDPATVARQAARLVVPGGTVAVRVPNGIFHHALRCGLAPFRGLIRRFSLYEYFSLHLYSFTAATLCALLETNGFCGARAFNSPVTSGDPAGRFHGTRLRLLNACKKAAFAASQAVRALSAGRWLIAPSILVLAGRPGPAAPASGSE
jgi:2-polyprenyl-3-methyl-5-hydroxy-6-metoxy-1,4-benzoquinol methylase